MNTSPITLPVFVSSDIAIEDALSGGPASVTRPIESTLKSRLQSVALDTATLNTSVKAAIQIAGAIQTEAASAGVFALDSIQFQLSVQANGTIGFMGTSASMQSQAVLSVTLKAAAK